MSNPNDNPNGAAPMQAAEQEEHPVSTLWKCSYAFDVTHYADFSVPAATEEEAQRIAERLLESGQLDEILDGRADRDWDSTHSNRVFTCGQDEDGADETLEELATKAGVQLPPKWAVPPPPVNPALALTRSVMKAQIALWDAQGALEQYIEAVELKEIDVTEISTKASGLYSNAREIDAAGDDDVLRVYQAVLADGITQATKEDNDRPLIDFVEAARADSRMAELSIRAAASACCGRGFNGRSHVAWIPLYDLIEPVSEIASKLSLLKDLMKEGGAK